MDVFPPDSGRVLFDGKPLRQAGVKIGYMPEERGLYPKVPIGEQLVYLGRLRGLDGSTAKRNAKRLLDELEMGDYYTKKPTILSKGNQQKIQLAATLISDPDVVVLDEPFSGLDPVNASLLEQMVSRLISEQKLVLFSSHQMNYIERFCNHIAILRDGRIVLSGNLRDIRRSYDRSRLVLSGGDDTLQNAARFFAARTELVAGTERTPEGLMVRLIDADRKKELLALAAAQNFDLDGIRVWEPTLADIFVEYTTAGDDPETTAPADQEAAL